MALVEPDYKVKVYWRPPNDPNLPLQWHIPKISLERAWEEAGTGSPEVKVSAGQGGAGRSLCWRSPACARRLGWARPAPTPTV